MALSDKTIYSSLTILDNGMIEVRRSRQIFDDLELVAERYHRFILEPGDDVSAFPMRVQRIANFVWTPQVIADYRAEKAARDARLP